MAKGFILVDVPDNCRECTLRTESGWCLCAKKDIFLYGLKCGKPDWCPILELPKRKKASKFTVSPMIEEQYSEFDSGYNACLDYLEGKNGK